jgi:hypothetical protein
MTAVHPPKIMLRRPLIGHLERTAPGRSDVRYRHATTPKGMRVRADNRGIARCQAVPR